MRIFVSLERSHTACCEDIRLTLIAKALKDICLHVVLDLRRGCAHPIIAIKDIILVGESVVEISSQ